MGWVYFGGYGGNRRVETDDCFCFMGGNSGQGDDGFKVAVWVAILMTGRT